mmetsp:Transcript_15543/g.23521  ORF Transcript_15543/g.23521 Transcript_15543/m.23521 type:complete len:345 (-) Transcript_15543:510-1544(-)
MRRRSIKIASLFLMGMGISEIIMRLKSAPQDATSTTTTREVQEDTEKRTLCTMEQLVQGKWTMGAEKDKPPYIPTPGERQQKTCHGFDPSARWQDWEWTPEDHSRCDFLNSDIDSDLFCSLARNKTIVIQGDSISFDHFLSLSHLLGVPVAPPRAVPKDPLRVSKICNGTSMLIGKKDFHLQQVGRIIKEFHPDVMILNRGAHYVSDEQLIQHLNSTVIPHIVTWQDECVLEKKDCHFVWRSTVPGHPHCTQFTKPAESVEEMEMMIATSPQYNWDKFKGQNELVMDLLSGSSLTAFNMFDGYPINILRPDLHGPAHNDCLHTCLPRDNIYSFITLHLLRLWSE